MIMHDFSDDDDGYLCWIKDNPTGFVLNVRHNPGAAYTVLHRSACQSISRPRDDGAYTARNYRKVVAGTVDELRNYTRSLGRSDGSFSGACGHCDPLGG